MSVGSSGHLSNLALQATVPTLTRVAAIGGVLLMAIYCAMLVLTSPVPVQDLPDHLARAAAMSDLIFHGGARYGGLYEFQLLWVPYLLGDLILTAAVEALGTTGGAALPDTSWRIGHGSLSTGRSRQPYRFTAVY